MTSIRATSRSGAKRASAPVWSERDIDDVAAFLATLNDDYVLKSAQSK
nr:hypothetical protein [Paraburkholderia elongata]